MTSHRTMQWLVIKCLEWNLYSGPRTDWHTRTGLYWMILREGEGGCWLMWMEGAGVIWTASGSGIADQTQRHDLWDVINDIFLVVDHITHSLWSMKTTRCLKEISGKSQKYWYVKETKGELTSEMWAKKLTKMSFLHIWKGRNIWVSFIRMNEL